MSKKEGKFHLLYRYASCSAAGFSDLIFALSPSIQGITKHFSVTISISPAFYNTYFIILCGAFVHMFAELSLPLAIFCCQPWHSRTPKHNKPFAIEFTSYSPSRLFCATFLHSSSGWISFLLPYLIHLSTFFSLRITCII